MSPIRTLAAAATAFALAAAAGCGFGEGESSKGEAELRVTRDYGQDVLVEATIADPSESDTVMRALDAEAEVETRFGGAFVQSIDGLEGGEEDGRKVDWFFYVNGIESSSGAADVTVEPGDEIWWDHRDWTDVMRVPAVVGSFPEPLAQASAEKPEPVSLECVEAEDACAAAGERLAAADVDFENADLGDGEGGLRVLVGLWEDVREDETAALLEEGPRSERCVRQHRSSPARAGRLQDYDATGSPNDVLADGGGLVAALRPGEDPPVWVVTGTDRGGLDAAVAAIEEDVLADHYACRGTLGDSDRPFPSGRRAPGEVRRWHTRPGPVRCATRAPSRPASTLARSRPSRWRRPIP